MDLKATVNLPTTDFPMKANLPQNEPKMLERWQAMGLYEQIRKSRAGSASSSRLGHNTTKSKSRRPLAA